jgi:uncharacterized protein involved in exopolysaccharide biosynthesis
MAATLPGARIRRITLGVLAIVFAILSIWPRLYLARAQLVPNTSGGGLAALLGASSSGTGLLSSLIGGDQGLSIEVDLAAARSEAVASDVASQLRQKGLLKADDMAKAATTLRHKAEIEAIRGNILQISVKDHRPAYAKAVVDAYVAALRDRLSDFSMRQASEKKTVADNRLSEAAIDVSRTEADLDRFRNANGLAAPEAQLGPAIALVTSLQANLQAEQTSLQAQLRFATDENIQVKAARARIEGLKAQLAQAQARAAASGGPTLGAMTPQLNEYENLFRAAEFAQAEYEVYKKYMETITVEQLSSSMNMSVLDPPYLATERQFNIGAVGALVLIILLFGLSEFYLAEPPRAATV